MFFTLIESKLDFHPTKDLYALYEERIRCYEVRRSPFAI